MSVSDILEDKFENDLIDFLNKFQLDNDCLIDFWSWIPDGDGNYNLKIKIKRDSSNLIN